MAQADVIHESMVFTQHCVHLGLEPFLTGEQIPNTIGIDTIDLVSLPVWNSSKHSQLDANWTFDVVF